MSHTLLLKISIYVADVHDPLAPRLYRIQPHDQPTVIYHKFQMLFATFPATKRLEDLYEVEIRFSPDKYA
jgi:hypothetical protein